MLLRNWRIGRAGGADLDQIEDCGPDFDYESSVILRSLPNGQRLLLAGQKSDVLHALDPDNRGKLIWKTRLSPGGVPGGIEWGFAADDKNVYVPISDVWETSGAPEKAGGVYAVATNEEQASLTRASGETGVHATRRV